jgi:hypothetical protein
MSVKLIWAGVGRFRLASLIGAFGLIAAAAHASVIFTYSGTSSIGTPVSFEADLTISGNTLTVQLFNNSPTNSLGPNDVLGSFYFDIVGAGNTRPTLTYSTAVGDVYFGSKNNPDTLQTANANLKALIANDDTWQFKKMNVALSPFLGFGIGTVGNNNLSPNNFNGNIVDGFDYSIYRDDVITQNLNATRLVKNTATFTFTGVSGFTEADIAHTVAFGLGTTPDSLKTGTIIIPEPSSVTLAVAGLALLGIVSRRRA